MRIFSDEEQSKVTEFFKRDLSPSSPPVHPSDPVGRPTGDYNSRVTWSHVPLRDPFADLHDLLVCNKNQIA